jgi:hypothetical protein
MSSPWAAEAALTPPFFSGSTTPLGVGVTPAKKRAAMPPGGAWARANARAQTPLNKLRGARAREARPDPPRPAGGRPFLFGWHHPPLGWG